MAQTEYADFFPPLGQLGGPGEPWILATGVDPINLGAHRGKDLLLIAEPTDPASALSLGPYGPLGDPVWPETGGEGGGEWGWNGARVTLYPAATTPRSTGNTDTPAALFVDGILPASPNFGSSLFDGVEPLNRSRPTQGEIALIDLDGELDGLLAYVWDGAPLTIKRGTRGTPFSTWETVARFTSKALLHDLNEKRIALRDVGWQLQGPLHSEYYQGTGGLEGDAGLKGTWKPWALGYCFNVEPTPLNAAAQILQWSFTSSRAVLVAKHGGAVLTFHADYPTFEALRDATDIPSGRYGTCLAKSLIRPNITIEKGIRVDVIGDNDIAYEHPGPTTRGAIARRIATTHGLNRLDDAAQIDMTAFNRFELQHSAPVGWHFDREGTTKAEALDTVLMGVLGYWRVRPDGQLTIGYVTSPSLGASLALEYKAEGMSPPIVLDTIPPRSSTFISWRTNHAPQTRSELALGVDEETAAILAQPARYAQSSSVSVANTYPTARTVVVANSGFWNEIDADAEAIRQQGIMEVERFRYRWSMIVDPHIDLLGTVASINNVNRLGFGSSKRLLCVGIDIQGTSEVTFDWWG